MSARPRSELPPSSWSKNPHYVVDLDPLPFRVRAAVNDEVVVDSRRCQVMFELGHAPVYYVPRDDVRMDLMTRSDYATHCPYKGDASYWTLRAGDKSVENAIWGYEDPYDEMTALKDLAGVYWQKMEAWYHDDVEVDGPVEIAGRVNETNNLARCYPQIAEEWNRERNVRIQPYEFAADSNVSVWWKNATGEEWQERIKDRVLREASHSRRTA